eukprot:UN17261
MVHSSIGVGIVQRPSPSFIANLQRLRYKVLSSSSRHSFSSDKYCF